LSGAASPTGVGAFVHRLRAVVDRQRIDEYDRWLNGHLAELTHLPGYTGADLLRGADEQQPAGPACAVRELELRFQSEAALADYERDRGPRARAEAARQFGDSLSLAPRSLAQVQHADPRLGTLASCKNCRATLLGAFCASCGQRADVHVPSTMELVHEAFEGITHSDSRLWRTLRMLWLKPGELTLEFVAGRRESYLPPFRLYLVMSVVLFLVASFIHPSENQEIFHFDAKDVEAHQTPLDLCKEIKLQLFGHVYPAMQNRLRHGCMTTVADHGESILHVVWSTLPKAMFIFLPLIAMLHMLVYWWPRVRYAEHLLFFIHLHAFYFSLIAAILLLKDALSALPVPAVPSDSLTTLADWAMAIYTVLALKKVFARSWINTLVKAFGLLIVYSVLLGVTVLGVFVYSAMQV